MRDIALFAHIILGVSLAAIGIFILSETGKKSRLLRPLSVAAAAISWFELVPAGYLYTTFYPATKTLIKAGAWPWAHSIFMETKEHWGLLLPIITTVAALLVLSGKEKDSRKWWMLAVALAALIGVFGRIVKMGAFA